MTAETDRVTEGDELAKLADEIEGWGSAIAPKPHRLIFKKWADALRLASTSSTRLPVGWRIVPVEPIHARDLR